jgi:hypothetical protein
MTTTKSFANLLILIGLAVLFYLSVFFGKPAGRFDVFLFPIGLFLGMIFLEVDERYAFKFYQLVDSTQKRLVTRSLLFLMSLFPLGIFLMTSTGSATGVGLFLGIIAILSLEMSELRNNPEAFHERFMYQLRRKLNPEELKWFVSAFVLASFLFSFFIIFLGR